MTTGNSPEQSNGNPSQENLAAQAAREIISRIRAINSSSVSNQQKDQQKSDLTLETIRDYKRAQEALRRLRETEKSKAPTEELNDKIQKEQENLSLSLFKACTLAKNNIRVVKNDNAQNILEGLSEAALTDSEALAIQDVYGDYLLGDKTDEIILTKLNETKSQFVKKIPLLVQKNQGAAIKFFVTLGERSTDFGMSQDEYSNLIRSNFNPETPSDDLNVNPMGEEESNLDFINDQTIRKEMIDAGLGRELGYYQLKLTKDQIKLVQIFYSPTAFVEYMEELGNPKDEKELAKAQTEKQEIREKIRNRFIKNPETLNGVDLEQGIEQEFQKHWDQKISKKIKDKVSDIVNELFLVLQTAAPNKYYQEALQDTDPFFGPKPILNKIQTALLKLMSTTTNIEMDKSENNPLRDRIKKLKLYRDQEEDPYIDERDGKLYPRIKPLAIGKKILMSEFVESINSMINTKTQADEFLLNSRAIFNHAAGEKGFYQQLGDFAESLKGADIDEILALPDGQLVLEAYMLYEKYLKADFASLDWHHRPDQFQAKLDMVDSKLELQMIEQMRLVYPELTIMKIKSAVHNAVGVSRGLTLSEPETSAYADSIDAKGKGMVASFSTNDAQSLNVFNTLHNALRWQGEHNWNLMYFMPVEGRRGIWKHEEAKQNMAKFMDSLVAGHGRGDLPKLFVDILMDINHVGGPQGKRKGWRNEYAFDGHYEFYKDVDGNNTGKINPFETFKAMEAIGYEGVANFIGTDQVGKDLMKEVGGDKKKDKVVKDRRDFFLMIYKRYIYEGDDIEKFEESNFENYMAKLRKAGEERALRYIKGLPDEGSDTLSEKKREKGIPIIGGSWEEQITFATSQIFMESTLAHYTAARMPTLFLKIGRNRFTKDGISDYERAYLQLHDDRLTDNKARTLFDKTIKDFSLVEWLLRREISGKIREEMSFNESFGLNQINNITDIRYRLNSTLIEELLSKKNQDGKALKSDEEIKRVKALWEYMKKDFFETKTDEKGNKFVYLDNMAFKAIKEYPFTLGLEDTDMSLVAYRGTGPRMVARAIKDTASIEQSVTPWLMNMPNIMSAVATDGKHDISPLIEYMLKAKKAINDVHGSEMAQEFIFKASSGIINYFKRDGMAKPLFGLFKFNQINSNAAEYSSSSSAVWEWESKEIDNLCITLRSHRLLPGTPYDLNKTELIKDPKTGKETVQHVGGKLEDVWWINPITKKPFKTIFKKRHVDFEWNVARLRKEHGADWKAIGWDYFNKYIPLFLMILIGKYIKDALEEMMGKKK